MVIVKLYGGLGNQMFQYALGLKMAKKLRTELKMDLGFFQTAHGPLVTSRAYELDSWGIAARQASERELRPYLSPNTNLISRLIVKLSGPSKRYVKVREKQFNFDPSIGDLHGELYLDGYWQSAYYFNDTEEFIRTAYCLKTVPDERNLRMETIVTNSESVAIHVRRMDYVKNPEVNSFHGVLEAAYYLKAVRLLQEKYTDLHLFLFSDDPLWVAENLKFDVPSTVIQHNDSSQSHMDMWLMSRCKHQIIANSSFSWWAAWLNQYPNKTVVAPLNWFADKNRNTNDLIPTSWIRL
jgi:glycosyltransferase involved in cell wall biosynthesis